MLPGQGRLAPNLCARLCLNLPPWVTSATSGVVPVDVGARAARRQARRRGAAVRPVRRQAQQVSIITRTDKKAGRLLLFFPGPWRRAYGAWAASFRLEEEAVAQTKSNGTVRLSEGQMGHGLGACRLRWLQSNGQQPRKQTTPRHATPS